MTARDQLRQARTRQLRDATAARSADSLARARRAIIALTARDVAVTFAAVAAEAKVSLSYLYKQPELASEIRQHRSAPRPQPCQARAGRNPASADSLRTQLTVAADRLRTLEREVRDLRAENEILRGEVLDLQRRQHRTTGHRLPGCPPPRVEDSWVINGQAVAQAVPESPYLLFFPPGQRGVTIDDLRLRAPVHPLPAAALPVVGFPVDQPDLGQRLPGVLAGPEGPISLGPRSVQFVLADSPLDELLWTILQLPLKVLDPGTESRHHTFVFALLLVQKGLPQPDVLRIAPQRHTLMLTAVSADERPRRALPARLGLRKTHLPRPTATATHIAHSPLLVRS